MSKWVQNAVFYHIYPLGFCDAPRYNDFIAEPRPKLETVIDWIGHIEELGANAVYFGPLFESSSHGYDTADYFKVDRRLGDCSTLAGVIGELHRRGIRVVLDGVFNHVGRDFWAFRDVLKKGKTSKYCRWFSNLNFSRKSSYNDPFSYEGWKGCYNLVKLNVNNSEVEEHIFKAVNMWIDNYDLDGIRLDCADCIDLSFLRRLARFCKSIRPDFWLLGEVVRGDYNRWVNEQTLDSATNYECYKGLYSSHNDKNYFEIAYSLNRQFGKEEGIYRDLLLYSFADNHDVNRIASTLNNPAYLYPLHVLLFTMPGIPSIYYGSEWGIEGKKSCGSDENLRPALNREYCSRNSPNRDLAATISRLARIRKASKPLLSGDYKTVLVKHEQYAFARKYENECIIVIVNSADRKVPVEINIPVGGSKAIDLLNPGEDFEIKNGKCSIPCLYPCWGRILQVKQF